MPTSAPDTVVLLLILGLILVGELLYRQRPGAGGLLYNITGTAAGVIWVLVGAFLLWGGAYLLGALIIVIGVNIHRSNYRASRKGLRGSVNG